MQTPLLLTGPLSLGDIFDRAIRLYRARFGDLIRITALLAIPIALLRIAIINLFPPAPVFAPSPFDDPMAGLLLRLQQLAQAGGSENSLLLVATVFFSLIATLALTTQCISLVHGKTLGVQESISTGLTHFWAFFGMTLLIGVAIVSVALVGIIPGFCIGPFFVLLVVPAIIYLSVRWFHGHAGSAGGKLGSYRRLAQQLAFDRRLGLAHNRLPAPQYIIGLYCDVRAGGSVRLPARCPDAEQRPGPRRQHE